MVEAVIAMLALEHDFLPGTLNLADPDPACRARVLTDGVARRVDHVLSNSFGFGGTNSSLVFARGSAAASR